MKKTICYALLAVTIAAATFGQDKVTMSLSITADLKANPAIGFL